MTDWTQWIGRTVSAQDVLTQGVVDRYRATLDSAETGDIAPQGIHWCLCLTDAPTAILGPDGHPMRDDDGKGFLPPLPAFPRRMWAASAVTFRNPIRVGATIERRSTVADIREKTGRSGTMVFATVAHDTLADGVVSVTEQQTIVYREESHAAPGFIAPRPAGEQPDAGVWPVQRRLTPSEPLLMRYSALTFNAHRIHYDLPYTREVEGYPGLVVHGPLTASLLLDHGARTLGSNQIKQFSFRGVAPAFCGEAMDLVLRDNDGELTLTALGPGGAAMEATAQL